MNTLLKFVIALCLPVNILFCHGQANDILEEVKLPVERVARIFGKSNLADVNGAHEPNPFSSDKTAILRDPSTGSARRVIGSPEKIKGYEKISEGNVDEAARAFLRSKEKELGLAGVGLKLRRATHVNGRWYVTYGQVYKGLDVLLTEVELRIFDNGNVAMYGADVIRDLNLDVNPKLSSASVSIKLQKEIERKANVDKLQSSEALYALPIKTGSGVVCRLVRRNELIAEDGSRFINYSDANVGGTIWRFEKTTRATDEISSSGLVRKLSAIDSPRKVDFSHLKVNVGGKEYFTNSEGKITGLAVTENVPVVASFTGKYATVKKKNGGPASKLFDTLRPGTPLNLTWNDNNSHAFERSAYYHTDLIHRDLKSVDPNLTVMDFPMAVVIDYAGQAANAYSNGRDSIVFVAAENPEANMVESPSILYHEYTHSLNGILYEHLGKQDGMINASANEGLADLYGSILLCNPKIGLGTFKGDTAKFIRSVENNNIYPDSIGADSHFNGQILAGAYWDLAKATSFDFVKKLSHFVKYATPDDPNIGVAFSEWFLETLVADDDDGDLTNGTPHCSEIVTAFNKHHIGTDLLLIQSFKHDALQHTLDTINAFPVKFTLIAPLLENYKLNNVKVMYSIDNWKTSNEIAVHKGDDGLYIGLIPQQSAGIIVSYYITAIDDYSNREINLIKEKYGKNKIDFTVGFKTVLIDNCESDLNWGIGDASNDIGSNGYWECAEPQLVDLTELSGGNFGLMQIGKDHSANGTKCFVTDATGLNMSNPGVFPSYMVMGRKTLYTPVYSLKGLDKPILKFWRFSTLESLNYFDCFPSTQVYVSSNEGESWIPAATYSVSTEDWTQELINLQALSPGAELIQLKFVAENIVDLSNSKLNLCEALIDDIEILALNGTVGASEENSILNLVLYPNPAAETITALAPENGVLTITDALGNVKSQTTVVEGRNVIDVNKLTAGLYFAKITSPGGIKVEKFIKK